MAASRDNKVQLDRRAIQAPRVLLGRPALLDLLDLRGLPDPPGWRDQQDRLDPPGPQDQRAIRPTGQALNRKLPTTRSLSVGGLVIPLPVNASTAVAAWRVGASEMISIRAYKSLRFSQRSVALTAPRRSGSGAQSLRTGQFVSVSGTTVDNGL